jgi:hypothetical protein
MENLDPDIVGKEIPAGNFNRGERGGGRLGGVGFDGLHGKQFTRQ